MNSLTYQSLCISTSFTKSKEYLELNCIANFIDERSGHEQIGGTLKVIVLSEYWTGEELQKLSNGIDERLSLAIGCLMENSHNLGATAVILESEFVGVYRDFIDNVFSDITTYLEDVIRIDNIITSLPFSLGMKRNLGYKRMNGIDGRSYSVKKVDQELMWDESEVYDEGLFVNTQVPAKILNRIRSIDAAEAVLSILSNDTKLIIKNFKSTGNIPQSKESIMECLEMTSDDVSSALMELLELDLLIEIDSNHIEGEFPSPIISGYTELDQNNETFLISVINQDLTNVIRNLDMEYVDINCVDEKGNNALFIAINNLDFEMVSTLLERGIDPNFENSEGLTAMKLCWKKKNKDLEKLIKNYGAVIEF